MNKEKYLADRKALLDEARALIDAGNVEEFEAKKQEIETLDARFDETTQAMANLAAIEARGVVADMNNSVVNPTNGTVIATMGAQTEIEDIFDSLDYRKAFKDCVLTGAAIPAQFSNTAQVTKTTDVGAVIPTTIMQRIVEKMETSGMILPLITRTNFKGGLSIPTSSVKPSAAWVSEGSGSDTQKKTTGSVTFTYHKLRCAISISLETKTTALDFFETVFINNVVEAMTKALETAIISGDGSGKPKGILAETIVTGQGVELTEGNDITYADLCDAEAKLPLAYENGAVWFMTKATFMKFVGMTDDNGQPIARVNYGIGGKPERTLLGRTVICNDYMASYSASVTADTVIAFLFNPKDYVLNTNLNMTIKQYEDNTTDDTVTKAIMLTDGKVVDKNSLVTVTIKNS